MTKFIESGGRLRHEGQDYQVVAIGFIRGRALATLRPPNPDLEAELCRRLASEGLLRVNDRGAYVELPE